MSNDEVVIGWMMAKDVDGEVTLVGNSIYKEKDVVDRRTDLMNELTSTSVSYFTAGVTAKRKIVQQSESVL